MKIEDYNVIMNEIAQAMSDPTKVDVPKITTSLSKLRDDYGEVIAQNEKVTKDYDDTKKAYEEALKYNMQLFLDRGVKQSETAHIEDKDESIEISDLDLSDL
jgi:hypothetical protein